MILKLYESFFLKFNLEDATKSWIKLKKGEKLETLSNVLIRFENWNISASQGKDKLAWVWRMEDVECGFGTVVSSIRLPFSFYISPPPRLTAIRWPGLRYIVLAHWLFRPPSNEFDLSIDHLRFSPLFTAPKEIRFSEFIIAYIHIYYCSVTIVSDS